MTQIQVTQVPSEYNFMVTQELRLGQYDLYVILPPSETVIPDNAMEQALAEMPF